MSKQSYSVEIHWTWGRTTCVREVERFTTEDVSDAALQQLTEQLATRIVGRYLFDCGDRSMPLNPNIGMIRVTPIGESRYVYGCEPANKIISDAYIATPPIKP
jgi:hypothetical protein